MNSLRSLIAGTACALLVSMAAAPVVHAATVTFTSNTSLSDTNTTYDGQDIVVSGATVTIDGHHQFNSLRVTNGGVVTHTAENSNGLRLTILRDSAVSTNSSIIGDGRGHPGQTGQGAGAQGNNYSYVGGGGGGGAGHLSWGGRTYGSLTQPTDLGSGGGGADLPERGGHGGGAIRLTVGGMLTVDGRISANGFSPGDHSGGGAGGSLWITCGILAGTGSITANGGNGVAFGGGGGGGRIAVHCQTNLHTGAIKAVGGSGDFGNGNRTPMS